MNADERRLGQSGNTGQELAGPRPQGRGAADNELAGSGKRAIYGDVTGRSSGVHTSFLQRRRGWRERCRADAAAGAG